MVEYTLGRLRDWSSSCRNLEYNQLTRLERDVFTNLTYLHKLLLSHNQIAYIDDWAWQNGSMHFLTDL